MLLNQGRAAEVTQTVFQCEDLYCERDDRLLFKQLKIRIQEGDVVQVRGPNGSGKTTLLRALAGLSQVVEGDLHWQQPYGKTNQLYSHQFLYIGHKPGITGVSTPLENLAFHQDLRGEKAGDEGALFEALAKVGLKGFEISPAHSLSAGQQRRVALAKLYLMSVPLWILDEPFTALDKKGVAELEQHLASHAQKGGTVILTTHHELNIPSARMLDLEGFQ